MEGCFGYLVRFKGERFNGVKEPFIRRDERERRSTLITDARKGERLRTVVMKMAKEAGLCIERLFTIINQTAG